MKVGIVGMPNAGKSSLFTALTGVAAEAANYPFTTIEPNVAVVPVADERLDAVAETIKALEDRARHDRLPRHRRAWWRARTAARGSATSSWPTSARPTRSCMSSVPTRTPNVVHPEGRVDPLADIETIETELMYADLEQAERRLERVSQTAKSGDRHAVAEEAWLRRADRGAPGRPAGADRAARRPTRPTRCALLPPLTAKPVLFVANVDEGHDEVPPAIARACPSRMGADAVAVSARLEAELAELDDDEAAAMRADLGLSESGLERRRARGVRAARADRVLHRRRGQAGPVLAPAPAACRCGTPPA